MLIALKDDDDDVKIHYQQFQSVRNILRMVQELMMMMMWTYTISSVRVCINMYQANDDGGSGDDDDDDDDDDDGDDHDDHDDDVNVHYQHYQ